MLQEELFEWGNPKAKNLPVLKASEEQIANAAYRWRKKVQSSASDSRVFKNFRPILLTTKNDSLRTMVEAGGGIVILIREGYVSDFFFGSCLKRMDHLNLFAIQDTIE